MNFLAPGFPRRLLQGPPNLVALLVDRGDRSPGGDAEPHQGCLRELEARLDCLRHGVGSAEADRDDGRGQHRARARR